MPSEHCCLPAQPWRSFAARRRAIWACSLLLLVSDGPASAADALARAGATVIQAVQVKGLLGTPVSVQDIVNALNAPAGPATGGPAIQLPSLLPFGLAEADASSGLVQNNPDEAGTSGEAQGWTFSAGLLQRGLVAAISAVKSGADSGEAEQVSITVGFN